MTSPPRPACAVLIQGMIRHNACSLRSGVREPPTEAELVMSGAPWPGCITAAAGRCGTGNDQQCRRRNKRRQCHTRYGAGVQITPPVTPRLNGGRIHNLERYCICRLLFVVQHFAVHIFQTGCWWSSILNQIDA